jgi:UDP-GlcNAc:undecaprenyl-phosphate GlcNAc-1-phosphate transferase
MTFAIPALAAFVLTLLLTPACRVVSRRFGWVDHPDTRKLHRVAIPRVGGMAIFAGYAVGTMSGHSWAILPAVGAAFLTGLLDDLVNLKPRTKIAGQVLAALLACAAGQGGTTWWHVPFAVVWFVGCTNAVNLIDGLDGLAAGVGFFAAAAAFLSALLSGNVALALITAPLLGALLGFLPYNSNPASIFMGDCGSNTIGFLLGCFSIALVKSNPTVPAMGAPMVALTIPLLDTALAIFRRFLRREPIFGADLGHIHHRLLSRGYSSRSVAFILYGAAAFFAGVSVLWSAGAYREVPLAIAFCIAIWLALRYLQYDEFESVRSVCFGGLLRSALAADLAVRQLEEAIEAAQSLDECWFALRSSGRSLGLSGANMQIGGTTFSGRFSDSGITEAGCSLRVPLEGAGSIELEIPFGSTPVSVDRLVNSLRTVLAPKLQAVRPLRAFAAAGGRR